MRNDKNYVIFPIAMKYFAIRNIDFESCKPTNVLIYILIFCIIHNHLIIGGAKRMLAIKKGTYPD